MWSTHHIKTPQKPIVVAMLRRCHVLLFPRGRFSSMLDMGGAPSAQTSSSSNRMMDANKNNRVRAVALDFDLITGLIANNNKNNQMTETLKSNNSSNRIDGVDKSSDNLLGDVKPDVGMIEGMAKLLNVRLGGNSTTTRSKQFDDDLSALTGQKTKQQQQKEEEELKPKTSSSSSIQKAPPMTDVRIKYASKLKDRLEGGLSGVERARAEASLFSNNDQSDVATGRLEARKMAIASSAASTTGSKWLATTGTGTLLMYLSSRSIRLALLPLPFTNDNNNATIQQKQEEQGNRMDDLTRQLPQVQFHLLIKETSSDQTCSHILQSVSSEFKSDIHHTIPPIAIMVVSDRDDYLRAAKDLGMFACRVRPTKNAPKGNVTAHYTVDTMDQVQDVLNEINGISFNTVLNS